MNTTDTKKIPELTPEDLAMLGEGALGYIRRIEVRDAQRLMGGKNKVAPDATLFCLYNANGTPISISGSRDDAIGSAFEHELMPMSVH